MADEWSEKDRRAAMRLIGVTDQLREAVNARADELLAILDRGINSPADLRPGEFSLVMAAAEVHSSELLARRVLEAA
jgi:hypothetical protein